jgi:hypothetical protein
MRWLRLSNAIVGLCGILMLCLPSKAQEWGGWVPIHEDYARGWGANRAFWWSDLGPSPYWGGTSFDHSLGWPYDTWYGPTTTYTYRVVPPPTVVAARNVVTDGLGRHCFTTVKICVLKQASNLGADCACKVGASYARGAVSP